MQRRIVRVSLSAACVVLLFSIGASGFDDAKKPADKVSAAKKPAKLIPLNKQGTVLLDRPGNRLLLKTKVVFRDGLLEMLCCKKQTKEHESILSVDAKAALIHTGLLALGAKAGKPVQFVPKYAPPTGQKIDIFLQWTDKKGKLHRDRAQSWVRHATRRFHVVKMGKLPNGLTLPKPSELRYDKKNKELSWYAKMTKKQRDDLLKLSKDAGYRKAIRTFYDKGLNREMKADWVLAGSRYYVDETTGEKFFQAEGGEVICVANFPTALIDVAANSSSKGGDNLLFEAFTERIPPQDTEVTIELIPVFEKKPRGKKEPSGKKK